MARQRNGKRPTQVSYQRKRLRRVINRHLPHRALPCSAGDGQLRWTDRLLVICALLIGFSPGGTIVDRFDEAYANLVDMHPGRRRPGKTYQGFIAALVKASERLLATVCQAFRCSVQAVAVAQDCWTVAGWVVFGVDGTKINCPMTKANEEALGCASRKKSWPQMLLTTLFHVGTGVPWGFARGGAKDSERLHLRQMLKLLPQQAMLLADAGFTGYELLSALLGNGNSFIIRVGANVRLLTKLGWAVAEHDGIVYLWPDDQQEKECEPMVLRLIRVVDGRNRVMHLLTNVLDPAALSDATAIELYKRRWLVEVLYRSLKQTLGRRKMLSGSPAHARVELDWSVASLWLLSLELAESTTQQRSSSSVRASVAKGLRAVRQAMAGRGRDLGKTLAGAVGDGYQRRSCKKARHWPHKKREKPPGNPKARTATEAEVALAAELAAKKRAA